MAAARRLAASAMRIALASALGLALLAGGVFAGLRAYGHQRLVRAVAVSERTVGPLRVDLPNGSPPSDAGNAARWIRPAVERLELAEPEIRLLTDAAILPVPRWSGEHTALVTDLRRRSASSLLSLAHAASLPGSAFGIDHGLGDFAETPSPIRLATGIRLLTALARLDLARGDDGAARTSLRSLAGMARALEGELDIVLQFTGWTAEAMFLTLVAEEVARPEPTPLERGTDLAALISTADLAASFDRFVAWNLANQSPLTVGVDGRWQWKLWARPGGSWRQRVEHGAIGELRAALELEALGDYARAVRATGDRDPRRVHPAVDDPSGANLDRFGLWMKATLTSRRLLTLALAGRRQMWLEGRTVDDVVVDLSPTPDHTLPVVVTTVSDRLQLAARGGDELAAMVTASRFNPAPPLAVTVAAPSVSAGAPPPRS